MQNKGIYVGILVFLLVLLLVIIGFGVKSNFNSNSNTDKIEEKTNNKMVGENKIDENKEETVSQNVSLDKTKANEELELFLYALRGLYQSDNTVIPSMYRNNNDILSDVNKVKIALYYVMKNGNTYVTYEDTPDGNGATGAFSVDYEYFKQFYKEMYGEDFKEITDYSVFDYTTIVQNGKLYSGTPTGYPISNIVLKANSLTKTGDTYELIVDALYFENTDEIDTDENLGAYYKSSTITYPDTLVSYKLKITYEVDNQNYIIKSMVAY